MMRAKTWMFKRTRSMWNRCVLYICMDGRCWKHRGCQTKEGCLEMVLFSAFWLFENKQIWGINFDLKNWLQFDQECHKTTSLQISKALQNVPRHSLVHQQHSPSSDLVKIQLAIENRGMALMGHLVNCFQKFLANMVLNHCGFWFFINFGNFGCLIYRVLKGGSVQGEGVTGEPWGFRPGRLGNIRGITAPP